MKIQTDLGNPFEGQERISDLGYLDGCYGYAIDVVDGPGGSDGALVFVPSVSARIIREYSDEQDG